MSPEVIAAIIPSIIALLSLIGSIVALRSQRAATEASAADRLSIAAARNAEIDSKRIDALVERITVLDDLVNKKDKLVDELSDKIRLLESSLEQEKRERASERTYWQAQIDILSKQVVELGGNPNAKGNNDGQRS